MAWIQIDDHFDEHPKLQQVGPLAWGVWLAGLAYCNRNLTDGFIPWTKAHTLAGFATMDGDDQIWHLARVRTNGEEAEDIQSPWVIDLLIAAGLWEEVDGGFRIHDYTDWQRSKAEILELREKRAEAGRQGGLAKSLASAKASAKQVPEQTPSKRSSKNEAKSYPQPQPQPNVLSVTKSGGSIAHAPARDQPPPPPNTTTYAETLNGALPKLESLFQELDKDLFTPGWLNGVLVDAERAIGPLSRDQLGRGLNVALKQMRNKMAGTPPTSPRPYARKLIVDYLTEQRDDHHAA
jgi:hypothetical protein